MSTEQRDVTIIDTGVANTASVSAAFERLGCAVTLTTDPVEAGRADLLVLPGVGRFAAGMSFLRDSMLDTIITDRVERDEPLLAVCLGLQLLAISSEESPGVPGLGIIDRPVTRFPAAARTPQHGWNLVTPEPDSDIDPGYAYYSNSYRIESVPTGWSGAMSDHAGLFLACAERGRTTACQFHPELSGRWGASLIEQWINRCQEAAPC